MRQAHIEWQLTQLPDSETQRLLAHSLNTRQEFPVALANILIQRGVDSYEAAKDFFVPDKSHLHDPHLMCDMNEAVELLLKARQEDKKILLFGDYDVDGASSVTLMSLFFDSWGYDYLYYIPDRYTEGYGVSYTGIDFAINREVEIIISLDCGIKAIDKIKYARHKGLDFVVCDHHTPGDELPEANAILDPKRKECNYPYKELTGCGVALKLISALHEKLLEAGLKPKKTEAPLEQFCDLVTLSIACDIVPITGENRIIAYHGLQKLQTKPLPGIKAIMDLAEYSRSWDISDLVFFVGPRVNAAGRLGSAVDAVEVLLGKSGQMNELAHKLQTSNDDRRDLDKQMTHEALEMIEQDSDYGQKSTTVLYKSDWHKGVIGIVASRVIEHYYRPTILMTLSEGKLVGSARSVQGFDLYEALRECEEFLVRFGGHKYAAGLSIKMKDLEAFRNKFDQIVASKILPEQRIPILHIDHKLSFQEISERFIRLIHRMAPFGPSNRKPVFLTKAVKVLYATELKGEHVRLTLQQEGIVLEAIGFFLADKWRSLQTDYLDIVYQPEINSWNGHRKINLKLKDIKSSSVYENPH